MSVSGSDILAGKTGIIFGALNDSSIAWAIAESVYRDGGRFILSNAPVVKRFGTLEALAEKTDSRIVWADATSADDLKLLYSEAEKDFGKIDFIVHSIGMGLNVRKKKEYTELNYDWYHKTLDISAISLHRIVRSALDNEILNDGSSILSLSYIGAQRTFSEYSEMGDAKALLESITRSYGYRLGKRGIRINSISQSPTKTTAGAGIEGFNAMFEFAERISPLGNADAESCADYAVTLLSDYSRMVTMQTLYHDGGFSSMGISDSIVEALGQVFENES